jgi:hypothetical protein
VFWGGDLAGFIADAETLADEPYLADVARLEWAVHTAAMAADAAPPQGLALLATHDPAELRLCLAPGTTLLVSPHPVVAVWQAHRAATAYTDDERYATVRSVFAAGIGQTALVTRRGWQPVVRALDPPEAAFTAAVLADPPLASALHDGGASFDFQAWFVAALRQGLLAAVLASAAAVSPRTAASE